jgi:hypothetical protein
MDELSYDRKFENEAIIIYILPLSLLFGSTKMIFWLC